MSRKAGTIASIIVGVVALAAAAYVAVSLMSTGTVGLGGLQLPGLGGSTNNKRQSYEVIPATEVPQTQPGIVGAVIDVKDKSLMVVPQTKGSDNAGGAATEVVITGNTQVYRDATKGGPGPISLVDGKIQQRVSPYAYAQIKAGDTLIVWGDLRGVRMVASVVIVEVSFATPAP